MRQGKRHGETRAGITLIEIVLVIAILALLGGIVYAAFGAARERGRQTICVSNFKQIDAALRMYRDDYGGGEAVKGAWLGCAELGLPISLEGLVPYTKTRKVFECPSFKPHPNIPELANVYTWGARCGPADDPGPWPPPFAQEVAWRGEELPILHDSNHNPLGRRQLPEKRVLILRLNGQIEWKVVYPDQAGWDW